MDCGETSFEAATADKNSPTDSILSAQRSHWSVAVANVLAVDPRDWMRSCIALYELSNEGGKEVRHGKISSLCLISSLLPMISSCSVTHKNLGLN